MENVWVCDSCMRITPGESCPYCGGRAKQVARRESTLPPETILNGRYLLGAVLGMGGFSITYRALDLPSQRIVAIKEYYPARVSTRVNGLTVACNQPGREPEFRHGKENLVREYSTLKRLEQLPGVVRVYNVFEENDTVYIVMEFINGTSLEGWVRDRGPQPAQQALELFRPFLRSLWTIHQAGVLHRDINPGNLLVQADRALKLIDFGSARDVPPEGKEDLTVYLRKGYAPPEQYTRAGKQGTWTDVYGVCAVLYFVLTGKEPMDADLREKEDRLARPSSLGVLWSTRTEDALMQGLSLDRVKRQRDLRELYRGLYGEELERPAAPAPPVPAPQPVPSPQPTPKPGRGAKTIEENCLDDYLTACERALWALSDSTGRRAYLRNELSAIRALPYGADKWFRVDQAVRSGGRIYAWLASRYRA